MRRRLRFEFYMLSSCLSEAEGTNLSWMQEPNKGGEFASHTENLIWSEMLDPDPCPEGDGSWTQSECEDGPGASRSFFFGWEDGTWGVHH
jgi:hypothetical protein